jgi:Alw26I/Eco31I/Esp3I family type II restriction m6 adenine DNA methyltransferase
VGLNSANLPPLNSVTLEWDAIETLFGEDLTLPMIKSSLELELIRKIKSNATPLSEITSCWEGEMNQTFKKSQISSTETKHLFVRGEHLSSYFIDLKTENVDRRWFNLKEPSAPSERERLACQGVSNMGLRRRLMVAKIPKGIILGNSLNYIDVPKNYNKDVLLALLNSSLLNWFFRKQSTNNNVNVYELNALPIKQIDKTYEKSILELIKLIESVTKAKNYKRDSSETSVLEPLMDEIDQIIYKAYGLNENEISLVQDF